jgi:hypothetical protein
MKSLMSLLLHEDAPDFLKPLYRRSDSQETLVQNVQMDELPTEILIMIAMASGFHTCMKLRRTCRRFRNILNDRRNWRTFTEKSPDRIESKVTIETRLHQFDQIIFGEWPLRGEKVPCIIHRTFLEQYDFLGGVSLVPKLNGSVKAEFFEQRDRLNCCSNVPITSNSSLTGGVSDHSCPQCEHYDHQTVLKTEFVHQTLAEGDDLSFTYVLPRNTIHVSIQEIQGVFGYSNDIPSITIRIQAINGQKLNRFELGYYLKYVG